jgi:hypothetical protein
LVEFEVALDVALLVEFAVAFEVARLPNESWTYRFPSLLN